MTTVPAPFRATASVRWAQRILGVLCNYGLGALYLRASAGELPGPPGERRIFVANHVSLFDTPILGTALWRLGRRPILVLGDRGVWHRTWLHRLISAKVGFLIDRDGPTKQRIQEMKAFGRSACDFDLIVFPEGTRGDGRSVQPCQPGIYFAARAAGVPVVPVFIENMVLLSSKQGGFHPLRGLRRLRIHFGPEIPPEEVAELSRHELTELVRQRIAALIPAAEKTRPSRVRRATRAS